MKLCFLLLLSSFIVQPDPIKKANKIEIINNQSARDNYMYCKRLLADKGIGIKSYDSEVWQISTDLIEGKLSTKINLILTCKDNIISINGNYWIPAFGRDEIIKIENIGMKGSPAQRAWEKMQEFSLLLGSQIRYLIIN